MEETITSTTSTSATSSSTKGSVSYWVVAVLGLLWNLFGGYDYWMTRTRNLDYLRQMGLNPSDVLAMIDTMPIWGQLGWGFGVWGSVAGSVLMLMRSRFAIPAFLASFVGAVVSFASQLASAMPASLDTPMSKVVPLVILAIVLFLWSFCRNALKRGILR